MRSVLFLFCIFLGFNLHAQTPIGFKAGTNIATFAGVDPDSYEGELGSILAYQVGILCEVNLNEESAIVSEFNFIQKGFRVTDIIEVDVSTFKTKSKLVINYLQVPIMYKRYWGDSDEVRFFGGIGPTFAYASSAYQVARVTGNGATDRERQPADLDDLAVSRYDLGAALGAGLSITLDPGFLFFETRYEWGFKNLNLAEGADANFNRGLGITMGYMVNLADVED